MLHVRTCPPSCRCRCRPPLVRSRRPVRCPRDGRPKKRRLDDRVEDCPWPPGTCKDARVGECQHMSKGPGQQEHAGSRMLLPARPLAHVLTTAHSRLFAGSEGRARLPPRPTPAVPPRQPPLPCQPPPPLCPPLLRQPPPPRPPSPPCLPWGRVGGIGDGEGGGGGVFPGLHPAFMPFAFVDFEEIVLNVWNIQVAKF